MSAGLRSSCSHPDCRANIIIDEGDRDWHWSISLGEKLQCCPTDEDGEVPAVVEGVRGSGNLSAKQSRMTPSGLLPPPQPSAQPRTRGDDDANQTTHGRTAASTRETWDQVSAASTNPEDAGALMGIPLELWTVFADGDLPEACG
eukprot:CAMPEP_0203984606 /NCGR_PEP_ID=MMETSP0360-20130528/4688_1 /ASSEMBLY_ACC=CAM_ASM_000342 /TAXON_ID=268821 /ORGANISM="Scrippsiella Hangoei, Strain SHTV-5" /LENGTH=144 /DNA_ID=CAMNT_0050923719 /DNA_START=655 /DNA_END=1087 /DNA_ORIENTATION=+